MSHMEIVPTILAGSYAPPLPYGCDATIERACELIVDAGRAGARWAVFPEGFIPGYPLWIWAMPLGDNPLLDALRAEALAGAVRIPGDVTDRLCRIAQRAQVNVAVGVIECDDAGGGTTWHNTRLFIDAGGRIVGMHRAPLSKGAARPVWVPVEDDALANAQGIRASVGGI